MAASSVDSFAIVCLFPQSHCRYLTSHALEHGKCVADCGDDKIIETEILWNAPMHSWLGTAEEAVEFLVILAKQYYNLGLTGQFCQITALGPVLSIIRWLFRALRG